MQLLLATATVVALAADPAAAALFGGNTMSLVGSAAVLGNGELQLVHDNTDLAGAAWLATPLSTSASFTARYRFRLDNPFAPGRAMADGFAFALQNIGQAALGSDGGNIGYSGLHGVGSIIQTWNNNRTGINIDGNAYNTRAAPADLGGARLVSGSETVRYDAQTHRFTMNDVLTVDGVRYTLSDSATIDLAAKFGTTMYAGFTGATGGSYADERLTSFSISPVPEPETYALMALGMVMASVAARRPKREAIRRRQTMPDARSGA